jgi:DNA-binding MarR family transcriptional regulator
VENFDPKNSIGFLSGRAFRSIQSRTFKNSKVAGIEITPEQMKVLMRLFMSDGATQQELANHCFKGKTSITRLVDNMEKANLVLRVPDKNDKRQKHIHMTNLGKELKDKMIQVLEKTTNEAFHGISDSDLEVYKKVVNKIYENLNEED